MTKNTPDLTVVVPTMNSAKTLEWTLTSLRSQDDVKLDIVVVDSHSTDGTLDICQRWRVRVLTTPPGNMYSAVNAGLCQATTPWLTYLNSDDYVYPKSYRRMLDMAIATSADVIYGSCDFVDTEGRFLFTWHPAPPSMLVAMARTGFMAMYQPSAIFSRHAYSLVNGFDERYRLASDAHFFAKLSLAASSFARIRRPSLSAFRLSDNQISTRFARRQSEEKLMILNDLQLRSSPLDALLCFGWRLSNWSGYVQRALRHRDISGRARLARSMDDPHPA